MPPADPPPDGQLALPSTTLENFAPSIIVVGPENKRFQVAVNAQANRHSWQITVGRMAALLEKTIDEMAEPTVKQLKEVVTVAKDLQEMSLKAYGDAKLPKDGEDGFDNFAIKLAQAAAKGGAEGAAFKDKAAKMRELGKPKKVEVVDVPAAETAGG